MTFFNAPLAVSVPNEGRLHRAVGLARGDVFAHLQGTITLLFVSKPDGISKCSVMLCSS